MLSKVMKVFYGTDLLPYKDKELQVHYPIVGQSFQGASQTTEIHFYIDNIGGIDFTWVALSKLPNGKIGSKVLESHLDTTLNEHYVVLSLSSFYTQYKGDLYISLQGYDGGVQVEYDNETEIYTIVGTPVIQATGSIKLSINYAVQIVGSDEVDEITLQELLAAIGSKLNKDSGVYLKVVPINIINTDSSYDDYLKINDIVFDKTSYKFYRITAVDPEYSYVEIDLKFDDIEVDGTIKVRSFADIIATIGGTDQNLIAFIVEGITSAVQNKVEQQIDLTYDFQTLIAKYGYGKVFTYLNENDNSIYIVYLLEDEQDDTKVYVYVWNKNKYSYFRLSKSSLLSSLNSSLPVETKDYDNVIVITNAVGSLSTYQRLQVAQNNCYIAYISGGETKVYRKIDENDEQYLFEQCTSIGQASGVLTFSQNICIIRKSNYNWTFLTINRQTYTQDQIDTLFSSALQYKGSKTVAQINGTAESGNIDYNTIKTGDFYNVIDSGEIVGDIEVLAGDNICWTGSGWDKITMDLSAYDDKFIAAGFFEVQNYNESTGEITFVYASDLYEMTYNSTTGVLTIEAN